MSPREAELYARAVALGAHAAAELARIAHRRGVDLGPALLDSLLDAIAAGARAAAAAPGPDASPAPSDASGVAGLAARVAALETAEAAREAKRDQTARRWARFNCAAVRAERALRRIDALKARMDAASTRGAS